MKSAISDQEIWGKIFKRNADVVARKIAGELFLVPIRGNLADMQHIFTLNHVAEYIWQELDHKCLAEIRQGVIENFEVEKDRAEADIRDFISGLLDENLICEQ
jgi:hypothetical protein